MAKHKKDAAAFGREALDALALLYHHDRGEQVRAFIANVDADVPHWRRSIGIDGGKSLSSDTRTAMQRVLVWDRAIKLLIEAGRLE